MSLGPELLKRFQYFSLVSRRMGGSPLLAAPRRRLPGGGPEVTGYRDYAPGDNFYDIHWTWCARRDDLLVKVYEGIADWSLYVLLDCSVSMGLGRPPKFELARRIAAALGYVALMKLDMVSVSAVAEGLVADLTAIRHSARLPRLLGFLHGLKPTGQRTDLVRAAETFVRRLRVPGPVVVLSDLYDPRGFEHAMDILRAAGCEPRLVQMLDPHEANPGLYGDVEICDVETQAVRRLTVTEGAARRHRALVAAFGKSVRTYCNRHGLVCMQIPCDLPEDEALLRVLGGRPAGAGQLDK